MNRPVTIALWNVEEPGKDPSTLDEKTDRGSFSKNSDDIQIHRHPSNENRETFKKSMKSNVDVDY